MPYASDDLRARWGVPVPGHPDALDVDDGRVCRLLEAHGFILRPDWSWQPPSAFHVPTEEEVSAIVFLVEEWDYGYLETHPVVERGASRSLVPIEA